MSSASVAKQSRPRPMLRVTMCSSQATGGRNAAIRQSPLRLGSRLDGYHAQSAPHRHRDRRISRSSICSASARRRPAPRSHRGRSSP